MITIGIDKSTSKYVSVNSWDEILEYFKLLIERGEHYTKEKTIY